MGNRATWKFPYRADNLLKAAEEKKAWHAQRMEWWKDKKAGVAKIAILAERGRRPSLRELGWSAIIH